MLQAFILLLFKIFPPMMFFGAIFGFFGVVSLGPRELPKKHNLNKKLSFPIFLASIGLFMILNPEPFTSIGVGLALVAFIWYTVVLKQIREIYPRPSYKKRDFPSEKNTERSVDSVTKENKKIAK